MASDPIILNLISSRIQPRFVSMAEPPSTFADVLQAEDDEIRSRRRRQNLEPDDARVGICLSGGGIRSALFSLGVLQSFRREGLFRHLDYLVTAQGGGLFAASLYRNRRHSSENPGDSTNSTDDPALPLDRLRPEKQRRWVNEFVHLSSETQFSKASQYLAGTLLLNTFLGSGLASLCILVAYIWRCLDLPAVRQALNIPNDDLLMPFLPFMFVVAVWATSWIVIYYRQRIRISPGQVSRASFRLGLCTFAIGIAVVLGSAQLRFGNLAWLLLGGLVTLGLLPLLRPRSLMRSGIRPRSASERLIFHIASNCLLWGLPLFLITTFARENVSGFAGQADRPVLPADIADWVNFATLLQTGGNLDNGRQQDDPPAPNVERDLPTDDLADNNADNGLSPLPWPVDPLTRAQRELKSTIHASISESLRQDVRELLELHQELAGAETVAERIQLMPGASLTEVVQSLAAKQRALSAKQAAVCKAFEVQTLSDRNVLAAQLALRQQLQLLPSARATDDDSLRERLQLAATTDLETWPLSRVKDLNRRLVEEAYPGVLLPRGTIRRELVIEADQAARAAYFARFAFVCILTGLIINLNAVSLLGVNERWVNETFMDGESPSLEEIRCAENGLPYPIACGTADATRESYFFSPRFSGSDAIGYVPTRSLEGMTFARALAVSGVFVEFSRARHVLIRILAVVFNFRSGVWLPGPGYRGATWLPTPLVILFGQTARWRSASSSQKTFHPTSYHYVSDAGNSDNLGLYELLQRRCRLIVVADATHDPHARFDDLAASLRMARNDLGIELLGVDSKIDEGISDISLEPLRPAKAEWDAGDEATGDVVRHYLLCRVRYAGDKDELGPTEGLIVLLRASIDGDEPPSLTSYRERHPGFPYVRWGEPPEPEEAEVWRRLGEHIGDDVCREFRSLDSPRHASTADLVETFCRLPLTRRQVRGDEESHLAEQVGDLVDAFKGPPIVNYDGFVTVKVQGDGDGERGLRANTGGMLEVQFVDVMPDAGRFEPIDICDGVKRDEVTFDVSVDSIDLRFQAIRKEVTFEVGKESPVLRFPFHTGRESGIYPVFVQVYQRTRRAQTVSQVIRVAGKSGRGRKVAARSQRAAIAPVQGKATERVAQVREIGKVAPHHAVELLIQVISEDEAATVRAAAVRALMDVDLGQDDLQQLEAMLREERSRKVREAAEKLFASRDRGLLD